MSNVGAMSEPRKVRIVLPPMGGSGGLVEVNGHDMTNAVRGITIDSEVGEATTVTLELSATEVEGEAEGQVRLFIKPEVRAALVALGWSPPEERVSWVEGDGTPWTGDKRLP